MKILITGARGQLGQAVSKEFARFKVIKTDIDNMDITDPKKVSLVFAKTKPNIVVHCAAYIDVEKAESEKGLCRKVNVEGTENVAKEAAGQGAVFIYISTDYVFDGKKKRPYEENDEPNPLNVYAKTKLEGEKIVQKICPKHYILRSSWIFGGRNSKGNFIEKAIALAKDAKPVKMVSDQIGSPTYTKDLAEIIRKMVVNSDAMPPCGIYHFSADGECSRFDLTKEIYRQTKIEKEIIPVKSSEFLTKAERPNYSYLDKSKIQNTLKIKVRPWQKMLADYLKIK